MGIQGQWVWHNQDGAILVTRCLDGHSASHFVISLAQQDKGVLFSALLDARGYHSPSGLLTSEEFAHKLATDTWT